MGAHLAGERKIVRFVLNVAVVAGAALAPACVATSAMAQILDPQVRVQEPRRRPVLRPTLPADVTPLEAEERRAFDSGRFGPETPVEPPRPIARDGEVDGAEAGEEPDLTASGNEIPGEEPARPRRVAPPQDGDPISVTEPQGPQDGIIDLTEPGAPLDGEEDITEADMRSPEDLQAFVGEPPAFDPLQLAAGEINPVFSSQRFGGFELDPFPPIGTRIGSFVLFTTVESDIDYNSNLFASPVALGDTSLEVRPAARLASTWSRHALEVRASGDFSFHDRYPSENDRAYLVEGLGRLDVTSFSNFQGLIAHEEAQESRSAINAEAAGSRPDVTVDRLRGAFNQRFNRLSVQLRGSMIDTSYGPTYFNTFSVSNADRDFTLYEQAVRPKWEFSPYLFAFADIAFNQRYYNIPAQSDGLFRSSTGQRYRFGLSFGTVGEKLRGDISLGYGVQTPNVPVLQPIDGLLFDAALTWRATPLTTVAINATSEVAETITAFSGGVMERTYGLEARHNFSKYWVGIAGVGLMTRDYVGAGITDTQITGAVGTEYYLNRYAVLFARYEHTQFDSSQPLSTYMVEEVQAGVRLRH